MIDESVRTVHIFETVDPCAIADIDVFQIGEMGFVKISDTAECAFSIDCGSGTGGKDLVGLRIIGNWPPGSAADAPADQRIKIPGAVDEIRVIHLDHLTADRKNIR